MREWFGANGESIEELKAKVIDLAGQTRYTEALPLLEKIIVVEPNNARMHFYLGFALIAHANNTKDEAGAHSVQQTRARSFRQSERIEN